MRESRQLKWWEIQLQQRLATSCVGILHIVQGCAKARRSKMLSCNESGGIELQNNPRFESGNALMKSYMQESHKCSSVRE